MAVSQSRNRGFVFAIAVLMALGPVAGSALAQSSQPAVVGLVEDGSESWEQEEKLLPDTPGAHLGADVAIDGDTFVAGAPEAGQAFAYEQTESDPIKRDLAPPEAANSAYGTTVDVDGNLAVVGDEDIAFVFEQGSGDDWSHAGTLTPPTNPSDDQRNFGDAVTIDATTRTAIVGAFREDTNGLENTGAAFVYTEDDGSWEFDTTLTPANPSDGDRFGAAVALEDTTVLIGAPFNEDAGTDAGAAYVFQGGDSGWMETAQLSGSQPTNDRDFGFAVALDGSRAIVGTQNAAYVFDNLQDNPTEQARLEPDDRLTSDPVTPNPILYAPQDVAVDGDTALIGAPFPSSGVQVQQKVFVFQEDDAGSWSQATELEQRDPESHASPGDNPFFGGAVAIEDDQAVVGASFEDSAQGQRDGGAVYLFAPCTDDGALSGPIHDNLEPETGPAEEDVHDVNCNVIASNGG